MEKEPALQIINKLRNYYGQSPVLGEEFSYEVTDSRDHSFELVKRDIRVELEWVAKDGIGPSSVEMTLEKLVDGIHKGERLTILNWISNSRNIDTRTIEEFSLTGFLSITPAVHNPTHLYIPEQEDYHRKGIEEFEEGGLVLPQGSDSGIDVKYFSPSGAGLSPNKGYLISHNGIGVLQSTKLPYSADGWVSGRAPEFRSEIPEHRFYCTFASTPDPAETRLYCASILSNDPTVMSESVLEIELPSPKDL